MPKRSEPAAPTLPLEVPDATVPAAADDAVARFEQEMQELETIVSQMEKGDLRLEDSLKLFERGTHLARSCRKSLDTAELKVKTLLGDDTDSDRA
ncbi:exodeoxyribonuclease VII small subunit [Panacagrimonas perspica]|uniref:Exodeoxyribonuclease 7 small subunit n=1 Tax=Panacagrimonas perspica TaxID=381431 RepID=A0A4R7PA37_9GAMM|nr:exodeoxyribonuclease VII small subunit [Panacagrimonas perspica]TDU30884.1 exodeoxyribonuclease VII small subunit [Panacagrimonas perspica]THD01958.1 exodeoxyribonuclease VII small subunit [Panacagrimonas perspica]